MAGGVFLKRTLKWYSSSFRNSEGMRTPRKSEFIRPVILTCSCIYPPAKSRWRGCTWIIFHPCELFTPPLYFKTFSALFSAELAFQQETFWELKKLTLARTPISIVLVHGHNSNKLEFPSVSFIRKRASPGLHLAKIRRKISNGEI